jgi:DNA modification methylase
MARLGGQLEEDNFDVDKATEEAEAEPLTKPGDIWILGKHRLMCGDSTDIGAVAKLMDGRKAHMIFTDPPWNVNYGGTEHPSWKRRNIKNDNMSKADFGEFLRTVFKSAASVCLPGAMLYCVMSAQEWANLHFALEESGVHWSSTIIWYKDSLVLSRKDYHTQFEPIFYGWLEGEKRLCPLQDRQQSDVWQFDRPKKSAEHPTMKPIALVGRAINNSSRAEDVVLDLFGGSGTTLLACEQTGRIAHLMELDPVYSDVIVKRWINQAKTDAGVFLIRDGNKTAYNEI